MFDDLAAAVQAFRSVGAQHRRACDTGDYPAMRAAGERLRDIAAYLRGQRHPELIQPLTMEWVTRGRDAAEHARHRDEVERLLAAADA